jgi:hypothetical protein
MQLDDLTNPELVTIAVALRGGDAECVDREDIAIEVDSIAPGRFSWKKYPERVDLDAVGVALRDAKKPKNGGLLAGSNAKGWMLSPAGLEWVEGVNLADMQGTHSLKHRKDSIHNSREAERARLRGTRAYQLFACGEAAAISLQDFHHFARINEYFQTKARQRRFVIVDGAVLGDENLSKLWNLLKVRFPQEMR